MELALNFPVWVEAEKTSHLSASGLALWGASGIIVALKS